MSDVEIEKPGRVELHESQLAYEKTRLAKSHASANTGRVVPVTELRAWIDSLEADHDLPVPRAP